MTAQEQILIEFLFYNKRCEFITDSRKQFLIFESKFRTFNNRLIIVQVIDGIKY